MSADEAGWSWGVAPFSQECLLDYPSVDDQANRYLPEMTDAS